MSVRFPARSFDRKRNHRCPGPFTLGRPESRIGPGNPASRSPVPSQQLRPRSGLIRRLMNARFKTSISPAGVPIHKSGFHEALSVKQRWLPTNVSLAKRCGVLQSRTGDTAHGAQRVWHVLGIPRKLLVYPDPSMRRAIHAPFRLYWRGRDTPHCRRDKSLRRCGPACVRC